MEIVNLPEDQLAATDHPLPPNDPQDSDSIRQDDDDNDDDHHRAMDTSPSEDIKLLQLYSSPSARRGYSVAKRTEPPTMETMILTPPTPASGPSYYVTDGIDRDRDHDGNGNGNGEGGLSSSSSNGGLTPRLNRGSNIRSRIKRLSRVSQDEIEEAILSFRAHPPGQHQQQPPSVIPESSGASEDE